MFLAPTKKQTPKMGLSSISEIVIQKLSLRSRISFGLKLKYQKITQLVSAGLLKLFSFATLF